MSERRHDEGAYVLRFVALFALYLVASKALTALMLWMGAGSVSAELVFRGDRTRVGGEFVTHINVARAIIRGAFVLLVARPFGYHRRDALWAAIPSPAVPYFAFKIAWRFVNLPRNRYWAGDPIDERDDFAPTRR